MGCHLQGDFNWERRSLLSMKGEPTLQVGENRGPASVCSPESRTKLHFMYDHKVGLHTLTKANCPGREEHRRCIKIRLGDFGICQELLTADRCHNSNIVTLATAS